MIIINPALQGEVVVLPKSTIKVRGPALANQSCCGLDITSETRPMAKPRLTASILAMLEARVKFLTASGSNARWPANPSPSCRNAKSIPGMSSRRNLSERSHHRSRRLNGSRYAESQGSMAGKAGGHSPNPTWNCRRTWSANAFGKICLWKRKRWTRSAWATKRGKPSAAAVLHFGATLSNIDPSLDFTFQLQGPPLQQCQTILRLCETDSATSWRAERFWWGKW